MAKRRSKDPLEDEIAELYSLPLEEFTERRDALAKRLRGDGDREAAERVRKLKKPPRSVWLVNQAARSDSAAAERLLESARRLERAQSAALGGKGSDDLKEAMAAQQEAIEAMMETIQEGAGGEPPSPAIADRARETLRAVAGDDELQAELAAARVTREREAVGFGGAAPATVAPPAKRQQRKGPSAARRRDAERAVRRGERSLQAAERRLEDAGKRLYRAQQALDAAQEEHDDAERERAAREAELLSAREALDETS
jgi:hypothetical protein